MFNLYARIGQFLPEKTLTSMPSTISSDVLDSRFSEADTNFSTADLYDNFADDVKANVRVCAPGLISYGGVLRYSGQIATVRGVGEVAMRLRDVLQEPGNGRVLVADGLACVEWALLGDKMASLAASQGWAGVILNGLVRDVCALHGIAVGVHALGTVPSRPKWPSPPQYARGEALAFQRCTFKQDAWVYADEDGILVADCCLMTAKRA